MYTILLGSGSEEYPSIAVHVLDKYNKPKKNDNAVHAEYQRLANTTVNINISTNIKTFTCKQPLEEFHQYVN